MFGFNSLGNLRLRAPLPLDYAWTRFEVPPETDVTNSMAYIMPAQELEKVAKEGDLLIK